AAELLLPEEGVLFPTPVADVLLALRPRLEAHVSEAVALAPLHPLAGFGRSLDVRARDEVVDLRHVADGPHEPHRGRLGLGLASELGRPLPARPVSHVPLHGVAARLVALER